MERSPCEGSLAPLGWGCPSFSAHYALPSLNMESCPGMCAYLLACGICVRLVLCGAVCALWEEGRSSPGLVLCLLFNIFTVEEELQAELCVCVSQETLPL